MKHLVLAAALMTITGAAAAADLDYRPLRESYIAPPRVIEERKVVEHHHYYHQAPAPVYRERVYVAPRVVEAPVVYSYRFARGPRFWGDRHFHIRDRGWGHGHHRHRYHRHWR
jgi:hypothetical protein